MHLPETDVLLYCYLARYKLGSQVLHPVKVSLMHLLCYLQVLRDRSGSFMLLFELKHVT
jgi:hypothetical protein